MTNTGNATERSSARLRLPTLVPWTLVILLAVTLVIVCAKKPAANTSTVTIAPTAANAARWQLHYMTHSGKDVHVPPHVLNAVNDSFQVEATSNAASGNRREIWTWPHTYGNVDTTVLINQPSRLDSETHFQPGIALRTHTSADGSGSAIVIDGNIWADTFNSLQVNVWTWNAAHTRVQIGGGSAIATSERNASIVAVWRVAGDPSLDAIATSVTPQSGQTLPFTKGDVVNIRTTIDPRFNQSGATVVKVFGGVIFVRHDGQNDALPREPETGTVTFHAPNKTASKFGLYPRYVRAQIIGSTLRVKSWLAEDPEPGWQATYNLANNKNLAPTGEIGLVANHLWGAGQYISFGNVTITPIDTP